MKTSAVVPADLQGVFAVPPLARRHDLKRSIDFDANRTLVGHISEGGVTRFLYGGNAFLHHATLGEYGDLLDWLESFHEKFWMIPSVGPAFGHAVDQAMVVRRHRFPCVMALPCRDPRDAAGLEAGYREIADAAGCPLVLYVKEERNFGSDISSGLDTIASLVKNGTCVGIKYSVVRENPTDDAYLAALLARVDRAVVISGMGERPAVAHLRRFGLPGFTTGSGCLAPYLSTSIFRACQEREYDEAENCRAPFLPLEDLRDAWGPARVLHAAVSGARIVDAGPIVPFVSALSGEQCETLEPVARALRAQDTKSSAQRKGGGDREPLSSRQ